MKYLISFILRNIPRKYIQLVSGAALKVIGLSIEEVMFIAPSIRKDIASFYLMAE